MRDTAALAGRNGFTAGRRRRAEKPWPAGGGQAVGGVWGTDGVVVVDL